MTDLLLEWPPFVSKPRNTVGLQVVGSSELSEQATDGCCKSRESLGLHSVNLVTLLLALPSLQRSLVGLKMGQTQEEAN